MFNYYLKNIPAQYVFGGYSIRKSFTVMTSIENGRTVYDTFIFTYVDNFLSFYIQMDNGKYKNVAYGVEVPEAKAEDLMSIHLARGIIEDADEYESYERDKIVGVFGLRNMEEIMRQTDQMNLESQTEDIRLSGLMDIKNAYMGMEVSGAINAFNRALKRDKGIITVPPIKKDENDPYNSLIGDEMDYFDFMSNKTSEEIIRDLKVLDDSIDGVGNLKDGKEVIISKGADGLTSTVIVKDVTQDDKK